MKQIALLALVFSLAILSSAEAQQNTQSRNAL